MAVEAALNAAPKDAANPGIPFGLRLSFGIGSLSQATVLNSTSVLLLFYMTNLLGIRPSVGGALLFISKLVDVLSNPLIGIISDRTHTRIGRRRPYLLGGGLLMAATFVAVFNVPAFDSEMVVAGYLLVMMILLSLAYAAFTVPYLAVAAETTRTYDERTSIMAYRVVFILVGSLVGTAVAPAIATPEGVGTRETFAQMSLLLGVIITVAALWCFWGTRRARFFAPDGESPGLLQQLRVAAANGPFVTLATAKLLQLIGVASVITCALYLTRYVLDITGIKVALFFLTMSVSSTIAVPLWWWLARRLGKKAAYMAAVVTYALTALTWFAATPVVVDADMLPVYARAVLLGISSGGLILLGVSMLPDTIEYDHVQSGKRREGIFTGIWSAVEKGAVAVGGLIVGLLLDGMGFIESTGELVTQPESAITGIIIGAALLPALFMLSSLPLLLRYPLTQQRMAEIEGTPG
ncbi:MAG: MFS transporter [Gammaproteobacteria bacterium]|nr:MFS transporter [Gammaproteobacteria bacterium]